MDFLFAKGLLIGFAIAAPVGPIGLLCIRRTLINGYARGFLTGLGAATADGVYGIIAGFGLTVVSAFLLNQQVWLKLIGGGFLGYLGIRIMLSRPAAQAASADGTGYFAAYFSTFLLTLTNPATILSFLAIFAGLGLVDQNRSYMAALVLVGGVFLGSALWWLVLSSSVYLVKRRFGLNKLRWVNYLSGVIICGFGLAMLASALFF